MYVKQGVPGLNNVVFQKGGEHPVSKGGAPPSQVCLFPLLPFYSRNTSRAYLDNGEVFNPPQPTVRPLKTEVCTFTKSRGKATGSVGVLTYDLFERSQNDYIETLAIMFSVPWDYNLYKNWFAVGIYKKGRNCDEALFKEMYYEKKELEHGFVRGEANGSGINYIGNFLDIKATMCPMGNSIMKVEIWDKLFTSMGQQSY